TDPDPIATTFLALAAVFVLSLGFIALSPESVSGRPGALRSLVPHIAIPIQARGEFRTAVPVFLAGWMTGGLFLGLVPEILRDRFRIDSGLVSGGAIAVLSAVGALSIFLSRRTAERRVIVIGALALVAGAALIAGSLLLESFTLFGIGTVVAGVGFGMAFSGEMRLIAPLAEAHQRGEMFAAIYVVCYLSFGVPAIIAGAVVGGFGFVPTTISYTLIIVASAAIGTAAHLSRAQRLTQAS
ncbi:MAG: MFS transporter, partial [Microbacteriaceae bacterium]